MSDILDAIDFLFFKLFRYRTLRFRVAFLKNVTGLQCEDGMWDYDAYMHGMANGMILALHTMEDGEDTPPYKNAPKYWGRDLAKQEANRLTKRGVLPNDTEPC